MVSLKTASGGSDVLPANFAPSWLCPLTILVLIRGPAFRVQMGNASGRL